MKGRTPTVEEEKYMNQVSQLGCIVCRLYLGVITPCQIHHIEGKVKPGAHFKTIGLCFRHHQEGKNCDLYVSRHPYKTEFEIRYGSEYDLLKKTKILFAA